MTSQNRSNPNRPHQGSSSSEDAALLTHFREFFKRLNSSNSQRLDTVETKLEQLTAELAELTQLIGQDAGDPTINGIIRTLAQELRGPVQQVAQANAAADAGQPIDTAKLDSIRTELTELVGTTTSRLSKLEERVDEHDVQLGDLEARLGLQADTLGEVTGQVNRLDTTMFGKTAPDGTPLRDGLVDTVDSLDQQMRSLQDTVLGSVNAPGGMQGMVIEHDRVLGGTDSAPGLIKIVNQQGTTLHDHSQTLRNHDQVLTTHQATLYGVGSTEENPAGTPGLTHRVGWLEERFVAIENKGADLRSSMLVGFIAGVIMLLVCVAVNSGFPLGALLVAGTFIAMAGIYSAHGKSFYRRPSNEDAQNAPVDELLDDQPRQGQDNQRSHQRNPQNTQQQPPVNNTGGHHRVRQN